MAETLKINPLMRGKYHNAGFDALVTAEIFIECMKRISGGVWIDKIYIEVKGG